MVFTVVAYSELPTAGATYDAITAVSDPHLTVQGEDVIVPPEVPNVVAVYGVGANLTNLRLVSPSIRAMVPIDIVPVDKSATPSDVSRVADYRSNPISLVPEEALNVQASNDAASGSETQVTAIVFLADGPITPTAGKIFTVKCTSDTELTAYEWTNGSLTFTQDLPAGRYQVVGMRAESPGLIAARLVFPGYSWRPGVIGRTSSSQPDIEMFRYGKFGVFGEFDHNRPPTVDFLSSSADTSETVYLDLIKVA